MAQFRTTADILDEILQKAGEPTNGNSPYETLALTYANKVHHAIFGGGSIFNLEVDESWVWAKAKNPIILELEPEYSDGSVSCTVNDTAIVFTSAPSSSLQGWHFQVNGKSTVYKITQHTAGTINAVLDSSFLDDSGAYSFRAFKLDYEILPAYVYIDNTNDRVDFQEGTAATSRTASLTHGSYTLSGLISHVTNRMGTISTASIGGSFDSVLKSYTVTCSSTLALLGATGANKRRSVLNSIGFDTLNYTGSQAYTSSYTPNSVARLIEPLKLFTGEMGMPFIYSTDPVKMQEDYPIALTPERTPDRFCRLNEENDGEIWIRFNAYPKYKTKVSVDWIPSPQDLQDNAASFPKLPRGDVDTLIHGGAAFIAFDKEDSKFDSLLKLCGSGLQAMQKKNRSLLFRTGESFGQMIPRADYDNPRRRLNYGYTSGSSGAAGVTTDVTDVLVAVTIPYTSFQVASTTTTVTARQLPATRSLSSIICKHTQAFSGGSITTLSVNVGLTSSATYFIDNFNPMQAVSGTAQASWVGAYYPAELTDIKVQMTAVGANLSDLAAGSLVLYFQESIVP